MTRRLSAEVATPLIWNGQVVRMARAFSGLVGEPVASYGHTAESELCASECVGGVTSRTLVRFFGTYLTLSCSRTVGLTYLIMTGEAISRHLIRVLSILGVLELDFLVYLKMNGGRQLFCNIVVDRMPSIQIPHGPTCYQGNWRCCLRLLSKAIQATFVSGLFVGFINPLNSLRIQAGSVSEVCFTRLQTCCITG